MQFRKSVDAVESTESLWKTSSPPPARSALVTGASCDVCVIGAGIAGLSVAYNLTREGHRVIVLDAHDLGAGQTAQTTAHLASALDEAEVGDISSELNDRFGEPPIEARRFIELMRLKTELRRLRVLGCEASARSVTLHLRDDTPLDPLKIGALVARKKSPYRLSPDGRLTRRALEEEAVPDGLVLADRMLNELSQCMRNPER